MDFAEYERLKRAEYAAFAETVASILKAAIRRKPNLRLQHVKHRAKDTVSLKKIEQRGILDSTTLEADIKDLAGCRLVFYTNSDVNRFLKSGIVRDNFDIDWDRTKIHYPSADSHQANDLFISHNYVVKLREDRSALPEYACFSDMWCEVQVQTTLNHAWSEMAHDTIYKKPALEGFGSKLFQGIEHRMQTIMRKFLLPAGYEFQKILDDFERLSAGKELFDQGALDALADSDNNNARHDVLERFREYVLPHYDDLPSRYPEIRRQLIAAVEDARRTAADPIETPFGAFAGHSVEQIVDIAAGIFEFLRYVDVTITFGAICELFPGACSDLERKRLIQVAQRLSKHELDVWKTAGPVVQSILVERIQSLEEELLDPLRPVILEALGEILKPEVTGSSSTYESVTLHRGPVQMGEGLVRARRDAIGVLKKLYRRAETDDDRRVVIERLSAATATPYTGDYSNTLLRTILDDAREIVEFYAEIADVQSYEILQSLENKLLWLYRRNQALPVDAATDPEVAEARDKLTKSILAFRDRINTARGFVVYKTLVGFDSVFGPAWDLKEFDQKAYRQQRITELVDEVTDGTARDWLSILEVCAQSKSRDLMTFPSLRNFLEKLGETKPEIVLKYLDDSQGPLPNLLPWMLCGLSRSHHKDEAHRTVAQWIKQKMHLPEIVWYLRIVEDLDGNLLEKAVDAALEKNDETALLNAVAAAVGRHGDDAGGLIESVFMRILTRFAALRDTRWVDAAWHDPRGESLFRDLRPEQADAVLESLVAYPRIEYASEDIVASIAESWPKMAVDFFGRRLEFAEIPQADERYESIPFSFHDLGQPLSKVSDYVVKTLRTWFEKDSDSFTYRGGRLVPMIFPEFPEELRSELRSLVRSGERSDIEFVISVLRNYEGQEFLHQELKEIVDSLPPADPLLDDVEVILDSTGCVWGEFGFAEAYRRKKAEIASWRNDGRAKVRSFAERQLRSLDRQIAAEQRRGEERLELRKRTYGEHGGKERP